MRVHSEIVSKQQQQQQSNSNTNSHPSSPQRPSTSDRFSGKQATPPNNSNSKTTTPTKLSNKSEHPFHRNTNNRPSSAPSFTKYTQGKQKQQSQTGSRSSTKNTGLKSSSIFIPTLNLDGIHDRNDDGDDESEEDEVYEEEELVEGAKQYTTDKSNHNTSKPKSSKSVGTITSKQKDQSTSISPNLIKRQHRQLPSHQQQQQQPRPTNNKNNFLAPPPPMHQNNQSSSKKHNDNNKKKDPSSPDQDFRLAPWSDRSIT